LARIPNAGIYGDLDEFYYHYTSAATAFRDILPSGELRLGPMAGVRDPIENKDWMRTMSHVDIPNTGKVESGPILERIQRVKDETMLLCLTRDIADFEDDDHAAPYGRGCARPRMWEQYGEDHAGVCLLFDRRRLHHQLATNLASYGNGNYWAFEVESSILEFAGYSPARSPSINDMLDWGGGDLSKGLELHLRKYVRPVFFLKIGDWASEQEFRYLVFRDVPHPIYVSFGGNLRAVVLGEKYPDWQLPVARAATAKAGAELHRVVWGASPPRVVPID
jgi:hypothetical protein